MKNVLSALLLCLVAACATTSPPAPEPSAPTPVPAPAIAWRHEGSKSYESQQPGLGVSHRYAAPAGWTDVYVYDMRRGAWETGVADSQFAAHFASTVADVRLLAQRGAYMDLQVGPTSDVSIARQTFRTVNYRYSRDRVPMQSTTYLTARNGKLLKYRISIYANAGMDIDTVARQFIQENLRNDPTGSKI